MSGLFQIRYLSRIPDGAIPICRVKARPDSPQELIDIYNYTLPPPLDQADLSVRMYYGGPDSPVWRADSLLQSLEISGTTQYLIENQFFELTWRTNPDGEPLYYWHPLASSRIESASVVDAAGREQSGFTVENGRLYHSMSNGPYWVKYSSDGLTYRQLLRYLPAVDRGRTASDRFYTLSLGGVLTVDRSTPLWIRFVDHSGWKILPPYSTPLTDPWWVRVRFNLKQVPPEYAVQPFVPFRPYMPASWVPGAVIAPRTIEFERKWIYFDGETYPDVLIYGADGSFKYALSGAPPSSRIDKGYLFRWQTGQFSGIDEKHARVEVLVDLEPDDVAYAFYFYREPDVVFQTLDVNPYTNSRVRESIIEFYFARRSE